MIQLKKQSLKPNSVKWLANWQYTIDSKPTYTEQLDKSKTLWPKGNTATIKDVKRNLELMCTGTSRCHYCEDSAASDIEHFWPKGIYPNKTFVWENYLYTCSNCNTSKSNLFEIYCSTTGNRINVTPPHPKKRSPKYAPKRPKNGTNILINPREENPLSTLKLDILGKTFFFTEIFPRGTREFERAYYTIETLNLNRDVLVVARKKAYNNYKARLREYVTDKENGESQTLLDELIDDLQKENHRTVWKEMIRQRQQIPILENLFHKASEALHF